MKLQPFLLHFNKWLTLVILSLIALTVTLFYAQLKPLVEIDWLDSAGEGGITLMVLLWTATILLTRPRGRVTNLLFIGLSAMYLSMLWDFLDEMFVFTPSYLTSIEAFPACLGMIMMSISAYYWYQEQRVLNQTLLKKERFYRDHSMTDFITGLYSVEYMEKQVVSEQQRVSVSKQTFCLTLFDVCGFAAFARKNGQLKSEQLLKAIADMLAVSIRDTDIICRFAADKFVVLHPLTNYVQAAEIAARAASLIANHAQYDEGHNTSDFSSVNWASIQCDEQAQPFNVLVSSLMQRLNHTKSNVA
ncbi:GGDEF domain-containing protein [Pseudoalteromonas sp. T1lg65]|uniref:GGDEF domain-containing protein n=1 Tax=Pseudoalteromonas sp. T1lg65 TaxID=2077101 RepID=UPI003F79EB6E